jgi:hypothetical protein
LKESDIIGAVNSKPPTFGFRDHEFFNFVYLNSGKVVNISTKTLHTIIFFGTCQQSSRSATLCDILYAIARFVEPRKIDRNWNNPRGQTPEESTDKTQAGVEAKEDAVSYIQRAKQASATSLSMFK